MLLIHLIYLMSGSVLIPEFQWQLQTQESRADFRGISVISSQVAWVSGTKGTVLRTMDGGKTWKDVHVPEAEGLDFRDIQAFDDKTAIVLSSGLGPLSRIYKTNNGGKSWSLLWTNPEKDGFYDALAFWNENNGMVLGDPVRGYFQLLITGDGGENWRLLPTNKLPPALEKEGAFAASGTCLVVQGDRDAWFCTGGAKKARVFHTSNRGENWTVHDTPIVAGIDSAGIFSLAFRDGKHGVVVGGDYRQPGKGGANVAMTDDGGKTWTLLENSLPFCSAVGWTGNNWIALGTAGSHHSVDDGKSWSRIDQENYNALGLDSTGIGWAVGPRGKIARLIKN